MQAEQQLDALLVSTLAAAGLKKDRQRDSAVPFLYARKITKSQRGAALILDLQSCYQRARAVCCIWQSCSSFIELQTVLCASLLRRCSARTV